MSQSALSHALARLRRTFDDPLFVRSGNVLVPTALARSIGPVRDALRGIEAAVMAASHFDPATSTRPFRIGLRQSSEMHHFHRMVARVAREAPGVMLASVDFRRAELALALAQGDLDLAIDVPSEATAGLDRTELRADTMVGGAAGSPAHRRRDRPRDLSGGGACHGLAAPDRPGAGGSGARRHGREPPDRGAVPAQLVGLGDRRRHRITTSTARLPRRLAAPHRRQSDRAAALRAAHPTAAIAVARGCGGPDRGNALRGIIAEVMKDVHDPHAGSPFDG
ncbi:LysR family transcriptional regulator [Sphingomonas sp. MMS24-JH45]